MGLAQVINGRLVGKIILETVSNEVQKLKSTHNAFKPGLAVIQVGKLQDSNLFIKMKLKAATEAGFLFHHLTFPETCTEQELIHTISSLNEDQAIHGIVIQQPLPSSIDGYKVILSLDPNKDVDGFHPMNVSNMMLGRFHHPFVPCTAKAVVRLLQEHQKDLTGKRSVILGRSYRVGLPIAMMLLNLNSTVSICHSKTKNIENEVRSAEIVISAVGQPEVVRGSWIKQGAIVIDVGISVIKDQMSKTGYRLLGDVAFEEASQVASAITPVPGGVGPVTVAMLLENTLMSAKMSLSKTS